MGKRDSGCMNSLCVDFFFYGKYNSKYSIKHVNL